MKLLLIEDSRDMALTLLDALGGDYQVEVAVCGSAALSLSLTHEYDLIILDLGLPDMPGLRVCELLRQQHCKAPIIIMTGDPRIISKITLLDAGADDYITKPFSLGELKARLRVLRRRSGGSPYKQNRLLVGDLALDSDKHSVERDGRLIRLRRKEFALLECLMQNAGYVVTRDVLGNHAWRDDEDPWANTIDVHIKYLRDKVDRPFAKPLIKTVHGLGYKLEPTPIAFSSATANRALRK